MTWKRVSGRDLQDSVVLMARTRGWRAAHFSPGQVKGGRWVTSFAYDTKGFPDLILTRERLVFAEVKGHGDTIRPEQQTWLDALDRAGQEVYVWTPRDWLSGSVDRILR